MIQTEATASVLALVPAWNAEEFIERTLDSLAAQTFPNLKVLIFDDASTDATADICRRYVQQDDRFSLTVQPQNLGWLGNANALLQAGDATYLMFAFHDDELLPDYVARCVAELDANPEAVVAYSDMETFYQDGDRIVGSCDVIDRIESRVDRATMMLNRVDHWWAPNRGVFRSEIAKQIGGMRRNLAGEFSADWPWLVHMLLLGQAVRVPEVLVRKHYMKRSVSRGWDFNARHQLAALLSCGREIRRAAIPWRDKLRLHRVLSRIATGLLPRLLEKPKHDKH